MNNAKPSRRRPRRRCVATLLMACFLPVVTGCPPPTSDVTAEAEIDRPLESRRLHDALLLTPDVTDVRPMPGQYTYPLFGKKFWTPERFYFSTPIFAPAIGHAYQDVWPGRPTRLFVSLRWRRSEPQPTSEQEARMRMVVESVVSKATSPAATPTATPELRPAPGVPVPDGEAYWSGGER